MPESDAVWVGLVLYAVHGGPKKEYRASTPALIKRSAGVSLCFLVFLSTICCCSACLEPDRLSIIKPFLDLP